MDQHPSQAGGRYGVYMKARRSVAGALSMVEGGGGLHAASGRPRVGSARAQPRRVSTCWPEVEMLEASRVGGTGGHGKGHGA